MPSPFWPRDYGEPITATKIAAMAGGAFSPVSLITGAGGFWSANTGVTLGTGSNVSQWNDQSSFANNLTNSGTASNVTFSSTGFNTSFPGISLTDNGTGNLQKTAAFAATATASVFILLSPNATAINPRWAWLFAAGGDATTPAFTCFDPNPPPTFQLYSSGSLGNGGNAVAMTNGTPALMGAVFDGSHANMWKNGAVVGSGSAFSSNVGASTGTQFGIGNSGGGNNSAGGTYAFWGITQKAMNTTDWTNLKNWSNTNWGTSF